MFSKMFHKHTEKHLEICMEFIVHICILNVMKGSYNFQGLLRRKGWRTDINDD